MKKILLFLVTAVLLACDTEPSTRSVEGKYLMPEGLSDCAIYYMEPEGVITNPITVVRCPLSHTSTLYPVGKQQYTAAVIEVDTVGMGEYLRLKKKFSK